MDNFHISFCWVMSESACCIAFRLTSAMRGVFFFGERTEREFSHSRKKKVCTGTGNPLHSPGTPRSSQKFPVSWHHSCSFSQSALNALVTSYERNIFYVSEWSHPSLFSKDEDELEAIVTHALPCTDSPRYCCDKGVYDGVNGRLTDTNDSPH